MNAEKKHVSEAEDVREVPNGRIEVVEVDGRTVARIVYQPGFRWSEHVKPIAGTELCEYAHYFYLASGCFRIRLRDGTEIEAGPGDVVSVPPGHDGWVVGDEPVVKISFDVNDDYAKSRK